MVQDAELLAKIATGDQIAMECFYKRHAGAVYGFALKTVKNPVDASEVLNEVMMEVWKKGHTYSGNSSVKTWLLAISHHKSVDQVRKSVRHDHDDESNIDVQSSENLSCSLLDIELAAENGRYVKTCLGELANGHRQVVYLTFYEGHSYPEIAAILEIPEGTVKTRMMSAKKQLLACLGRFLLEPVAT